VRTDCGWRARSSWKATSLWSSAPSAARGFSSPQPTTSTGERTSAMTAPQVVRITSDQDAEGFEIGVEPHEDGGWMATEPGFHGILPGPGQRMYINGEEGWVRR